MKDIIALIQHKKYRRIILWGITIGTLSAGAAIYELHSSYQAEISLAKILSNNLSHVLEKQLAIIFTKFDLTMSQTVRSIENKRESRLLDRPSVERLLRERIKDVSEAKTFFVLDENGKDYFRRKNGKILNLGDREYFRQQKNSRGNGLNISPPILGRMSNIPSIVFSRKILDRNNQFKGVVAITIPLSFFQELFAKLDIGKQGSIVLGSNENVLYARFPWSEENIGHSLPSMEVVRRIFVNHEKVVSLESESPGDSVVRYSSSRQVGNTKFFVHVGISKNEVLASWKQRCLFYLVGFMFFWVGGAIYLFKFLQSMQELDERRKMAAHNAKLASLGEMASGIAHEINNPLAVIHSRTMQLRRQIERGQYDPELFKESLQRINMTVDRIAKIIRGLKSFSRNADQDAFIATPLNSIIENSLELCNEKFRNQLVLLKIDPIPDITIECRESQMVQVMLNLLNNSYDAVEKLEEKWVHISFKMLKKNTISILITDSGRGIPDKVAQNIMQPFFTTKDVGKGTGLGLSISKGIIDDHEGGFYLDRKSVHTRFVIDLPIQHVNYKNLHQAS